MQPGVGWAVGNTFIRVRYCGTDETHASDLGTRIAALGTQLVDLRLCDVGSLFSLVQLMLQFAELAQMNISLFLLKKTSRQI